MLYLAGAPVSLSFTYRGGSGKEFVPSITKPRAGERRCWGFCLISHAQQRKRKAVVTSEASRQRGRESAVATRLATAPSDGQPLATTPAGNLAKGGGPSAGVEVVAPVLTGTVLAAVTTP